MAPVRKTLFVTAVIGSAVVPAAASAAPQEIEASQLRRAGCVLGLAQPQQRPAGLVSTASIRCRKSSTVHTSIIGTQRHFNPNPFPTATWSLLPGAIKSTATVRGHRTAHISSLPICDEAGTYRAYWSVSITRGRKMVLKDLVMVSAPTYTCRGH
jgi:hypothetical protein